MLSEVNSAALWDGPLPDPAEDDAIARKSSSGNLEIALPGGAENKSHQALVVTLWIPVARNTDHGDSEKMPMRSQKQFFNLPFLLRVIAAETEK
jgi:hypothetical protein